MRMSQIPPPTIPFSSLVPIPGLVLVPATAGRASSSCVLWDRNTSSLGDSTLGDNSTLESIVNAYAYTTCRTPLDAVHEADATEATTESTAMTAEVARGSATGLGPELDTVSLSMPSSTHGNIGQSRGEERE